MTTKHSTTETTVVVFRRWRGDWPQGGEILALFPYVDEGGGLCSCYAHVGQHSSADYSACIERTTPVDQDDQDVQELKRELERHCGYALKVQKRAIRR